MQTSSFRMQWIIFQLVVTLVAENDCINNEISMYFGKSNSD